MMMSNVPAKIRKKLKTAASARNVLPGWMKATMPGDDEDERQHGVEQLPPAAAMNSTPISAAPAKSATKPNRIEIDDTEV